MIKVAAVNAEWILDSRGLPTVSCSLTLEKDGRQVTAKASVPSGASTGSYEALELRDNTDDFGGKSVHKAVENINKTIAARIVEREFITAQDVDRAILELDTSDNKSELGANAVLGVSMASHRAFAKINSIPLWQYLRRLYFGHLPAVVRFPRLMCNVINGGQHADNNLDIQEFMVIPKTGGIMTDIQAASEIYHSLKNSLKKDKKSVGLGDEGGFAPELSDGTISAMEYLHQAVKSTRYEGKCDYALDCAANEFYDKSKKVYNLDGEEYSVAKLTDFYKDLAEKYGIISIEDGFNEDDIVGWQVLTETIGEKIKLVGDDLFVTNPKRFKKVGLENKIANSILIKLNQIGSVLETCEVINMAKQNKYSTVVSHRSGETVDDFMSDLAVASQSEFIKLGAPARGERVAKYNRLLEIKRSLVTE